MKDNVSGTLCCLAVVAAFVWFVVAGIRKDSAAEQALAEMGEIRARVGRDVVLFDNPLRLSVIAPGGRKTWPLAADTAVTVETAGDITAVRGRNLASKAVGGVATGGLGFFVFGNAKTQQIDNRELYIVMESETEAHVAKIDPKLGQEARQFAVTVNLVARQMRAADSESGDQEGAE
jgi:hypothetical protein